MKRVVFLLTVLALLPVVAQAKYPAGTTTARSSSQTVRHPKCEVTNIGRAVKGKESPEYQKFLSDQVHVLLGDQLFITFNDLMAHPYFKKEFAGLSAEERAKLEKISILGDSSYETDWENFPDSAPGRVSAGELLVMLVVLDASVEKDATGKVQLKLDTYPSLGEKGWLAILNERMMKSLITDSMYSPIAQEVRAQAQSNQAKAELQRLQVFNQNGSLNQGEAAKAMELLRGDDETIRELAKVAFGNQLKSAGGTGMRDGGGAVVELKDGTTLTLRNITGIVTIVYPDGKEEKLSK